MGSPSSNLYETPIRSSHTPSPSSTVKRRQENIANQLKSMGGYNDWYGCYPFCDLRSFDDYAIRVQRSWFLPVQCNFKRLFSASIFIYFRQRFIFPNKKWHDALIRSGLIMIEPYRAACVHRRLHVCLPMSTIFSAALWCVLRIDLLHESPEYCDIINSIPRIRFIL